VVLISDLCMGVLKCQRLSFNMCAAALSNSVQYSSSSSSSFYAQANIAHLCCHHRPRYMELLKKHKLILDKNPKSVIEPTEIKEIEVIECILPLHALIVFRQLVVKEVILLQHKAQQEKEKAKPTRRVSKFFKSHFGSKKKGGHEDGEEQQGEGDEEDISVQAVSVTDRSYIYI
jgi:hypothetical protein